MRILLTNNTLAERAGSELYLRDAANALLRRGHGPVAFSTRLGPVAEDLRLASVPVVSDLGNLAEPPDVIHGQHHLETMMAVLRFPGVPAVFFCHGWLPCEEIPPRFPRLLRYVAVDDTCRDRLVAEWGIPPERVEVILSFVDLRRFRPRGTALPERPRRALVFSNAASEATHLPAIRAACERRGIALDVAGHAAGRVLDRPEAELPAYDLVFAKARAALEAMAVGAAVVTCDAHGLAGLVTTRNFERLRRLNFGVRSLNRPVEPEALAVEIDNYDGGDAAAVSERVRAEAGLDEAVDRIEQVYARVLEESASRPRSTEDPDELRAASAYLRWLGPEGKAMRLWQDRESLAARVRDLEARLQAAAHEERRISLERDRLATAKAMAGAQREVDERRAELETLRAGLRAARRSWQGCGRRSRGGCERASSAPPAWWPSTVPSAACQRYRRLTSSGGLRRGRG